MKEKTVTLDKSEIALIVGGLIILGNDFAERLENAQKDENKKFSSFIKKEGKTLRELLYETQLEAINDLWEKIDPEIKDES